MAGFGVSDQRGIRSLGVLEQLGEALESGHCTALGSRFLFRRERQAIEDAGELLPAFGTATGGLPQVTGTEALSLIHI